MSHSQFHSINCLYLDMHGLIFETSVCYWQNQPGCYLFKSTESSMKERIETSGLGTNPGVIL